MVEIQGIWADMKLQFCSMSRQLPRGCSPFGAVVSTGCFLRNKLELIQSLERQLGNPFSYVAVTTKRTTAILPVHRSQALESLGAAAYVDDQPKILLQDVRYLQRGRPSQLKTATIRAKYWQHGERILEARTEDVKLSRVCELYKGPRGSWPHHLLVYPNVRVHTWNKAGPRCGSCWLPLPHLITWRPFYHRAPGSLSR